MRESASASSPSRSSTFSLSSSCFESSSSCLGIQIFVVGLKVAQALLEVLTMRLIHLLLAPPANVYALELIRFASWAYRHLSFLRPLLGCKY